jgi:hypothetical protein
MNKASVLIDVVAILQDVLNKDKEFLAMGDEWPLSFEEQYAIQSSNAKLQGLINHFQDIIDADINAYEISQGM